MKTLFYFRHSTKDGVGDSIGPKGLKLAAKVGSWFEEGYDVLDRDMNFHKLFHGPLIRTAQTALAFLSGSCYTPVVMPVIQEIGDEGLFKAMKAPSQFRPLAGEMGNYRALLQCHEPAQIYLWAKQANSAVELMFDLMEKGETAVAFGHSPMIELALCALAKSFKLPEEQYESFGDMEGVELVHADLGVIKVMRKLSMPAS